MWGDGTASGVLHATSQGVDLAKGIVRTSIKSWQKKGEDGSGGTTHE